MAEFKCNMCGGNIIFEKGADFGICDSCGLRYNNRLSVEEKSRIIQKEQRISDELEDIKRQEKEVKAQIFELERTSSKRNWVIASTIISLISIVIFFVPTELPQIVADICYPLFLLLSVISYVMLVVNTDLFHFKKFGALFPILGYFVQLCTLCLFGVIAGAVYFFKILENQKKSEFVKNELFDRLKDLENDRENLKNYSDYKR